MLRKIRPWDPLQSDKKDARGRTARPSIFKQKSKLQKKIKSIHLVTQVSAPTPVRGASLARGASRVSIMEPEVSDPTDSDGDDDADEQDGDDRAALEEAAALRIQAAQRGKQG